MDEKRRALLEHQLLLSIFRKKTSLLDLRNIKRDVGNLVDDPALAAVSAKKEEVQEIIVSCIQEVIAEDMPRL